jgi:hypothetical protein
MVVYCTSTYFNLLFYSILIFFAARSFTSSKSIGSTLTPSTSLAARLGVESSIRKASLTAEVSTPILRLIPPCGARAWVFTCGCEWVLMPSALAFEPTPIDGGGSGLGLGVGAGDSSIVGPVHFVRPATTSASSAREANLALG